MNKENINWLITVLEDPDQLEDVDFDMNVFINHHDGSCNTSACIAGYIAILSNNENLFYNACADWLGVTHEEGIQLFIPLEYSLSRLTRKDAIQTLTKLMNTGRVDWSHAIHAKEGYY